MVIGIDAVVVRIMEVEAVAAGIMATVVVAAAVEAASVVPQPTYHHTLVGGKNVQVNLLSLSILTIVASDGKG